MPGVLLQYNRRRGMALTVGLQEPDTSVEYVTQGTDSPAQQKAMPAASVITGWSGALKASWREAGGAL